MPNPAPLPRGIRNNNPGNMRRGVIAEIQFTMSEGYAVFRSPMDGLISMCEELRRYYLHFKLRTPYDVIMRWAPPSENDSMAYIRNFGLWNKVPLGAEKTYDLRLTETWRMVDAMRAIIHVENGAPPTRMSVGGEWFSATELWTAINQAEAMR